MCISYQQYQKKWSKNTVEGIMFVMDPFPRGGIGEKGWFSMRPHHGGSAFRSGWQYYECAWNVSACFSFAVSVLPVMFFVPACVLSSNIQSFSSVFSFTFCWLERAQQLDDKRCTALDTSKKKKNKCKLPIVVSFQLQHWDNKLKKCMSANRNPPTKGAWRPGGKVWKGKDTTPTRTFNHWHVCSKRARASHLEGTEQISCIKKDQFSSLPSRFHQKKSTCLLPPPTTCRSNRIRWWKYTFTIAILFSSCL